MKKWQKILYSAGSLGTALSYQAFGTYIQFLYIDQLGVKASLIGIGWSVYGIWNAVNDPLAGYWSDRTRTRWGRRIPWIAGFSLPLGLFFYLLWVPPSPLIEGGEIPLFAWFMAVVLVFDLLWTIVVMNWTALFPEMYTDEKERAGVSGWRQVFSVIGLLTGVALPPILVGQDWSGRGGMALMFAIITSATFLISLLGSKEKKEFVHEEQLPFLPAVKTSLGNVAFRFFLLANLHKEFIYSMMTASIPFYAKYALRIQGPATVVGVQLDAGLQNALLLGMAFIAALPAIPFWTWLAKRAGGRKAWMVASVSFGLSVLLLFFARDFFAGVASTTVIGLSLAGFLVLPDLLVADVVDQDEIVTGVRREGMFFGMNGFVIRFAFTMQGITTGVILTLTHYVRPTEGALYPIQPPLAVVGIRAMTAVAPMIAAAVSFWALSRYPLHGARLAELKRTLAQLHARKAEARAGAGVEQRFT